MKTSTIYIECWGPSKASLKQKYPNAIFVPNEASLCALGDGIKEALHDVHAPQEGEGWKVLSNGYYHSVIEVFN
jgi:hypothetical protein